MAHFPPGQGKPIGFYAVKAALHFISFQFEVLCGAPFAYATFIFYTHFLFLAAAANYAGKLLYYTRDTALCSRSPRFLGMAAISPSNSP